MNVRLLLPLLGITLAWAFGQNRLYGPITTHLRAGDVAPDFTFTKVLNAPGSIPWNTSNLSGHLTILVSYPDTSHNLQSVTLWNALVEQFADKPVQFVWITGEEESTLLPWLNQHPVKGWVFHDPSGHSSQSYGLAL
ncbi:MAG TPA: redoxin domain-containing protein, partial [Terriglobales bacterium]